METPALSDRIVATQPRIKEVIEHLEDVLHRALTPLARRRIQHALALLHATGDMLDEASLIERLQPTR